MGTPFAFAVPFSGLARNSTWWRGASPDKSPDNCDKRDTSSMPLSIAGCPAINTERAPLN
jgi:hypothetical protein